jgi:hypothetical protein
MAVEEAPMDGKLYGRKNGAWIEIIPVPGPRGLQGLTGGLGASGVNSVTGGVKYPPTEKVVDYALTLGDDLKLLVLNSTSEIHLIIPLNSVVPFEIGTSIMVSQGGSGSVKVVAADIGVTIRTPDTYYLAKQYAKASIIKVGTNVWELEGNLLV